MKKERKNCDKARDISIVSVLRSLDFSFEKENKNEIWIKSPFRIEAKASFKVCLRSNRWFDHGLGKGGNVIDLVMLILNVNVKEHYCICIKMNLSLFISLKIFMNPLKHLK